MAAQRIAIVIPRAWDADRFSVDPRLLVEGFHEAGSAATIFCCPGSAFPVDAPAEVATYEELTSSSYWAARGCDAAVVFTHMHSHRSVIHALRGAGTFAISKGDTSGIYAPRTHPREAFVTTTAAADRRTERLRLAWLWGKRVFSSRAHRALVRPIVEILEAADATIVETEAARTRLETLLASLGRDSLTSKIHVVPNPVHPAFLTAANQPKRRMILAVGRWAAREKNSPLLAATLGNYLRTDPEAVAVVAGPNADIFRGITRVDPIGQVDNHSLAEHAAAARICLVSSRTESFHLAAHEALATGSTVVGTPIPVVESMTQDGRFGTMARSHRERALRHALAEEMRQWDEARRHPATIAAVWRAQLKPKEVAQSFLNLVDLGAPSA